ncbi:unnamed protein product [Chondrus crispus]|uniref:Uncharacterized protein n=1 Tax=Chondrus crispus TaxID=2769 RepID=R7QAD8_CHOCR|nr:unnamed protein product [Chondrus crispus]CDF34994.1 unnamed protein product [Chondrus crispus]|eukprot:XP_005714813.1 unnamed protein product [Chondrus crispus]
MTSSGRLGSRKFSTTHVKTQKTSCFKRTDFR